jgi:hypothetical protein
MALLELTLLTRPIRSSPHPRRLAANLPLVPVGILEKQGVISRRIIVAILRPLDAARPRLYYDLSQPVNLFPRCPPRKRCDSRRRGARAARPATRTVCPSCLPAWCTPVDPPCPQSPSIPEPEASRHKISAPPRDPKPAGQCDQENARPCDEA